MNVNASSNPHRAALVRCLTYLGTVARGVAVDPLLMATPSLHRLLSESVDCIREALKTADTEMGYAPLTASEQRAEALERR